VMLGCREVSAWRPSAQPARSPPAPVRSAREASSSRLGPIARRCTRPDPAGRFEQERRPGVDQGTPKILIADDNPQNVELLEAYRGEIECEVLTAADGEETLQVVRQDHPDLVLLDVMMPRLSGFEVCRKLRSDPLTRDVLVLMVTALNETSDFERGVQAGTD